ncbi:alpha/beta hydrolase [Actinocorallia sp. API 0066]|uniref:alpha/beta hydrolase n=1 Tax=Actinocorallia sp. API 0066 TaxID=2896846 RepID=UPI001E6185A8|nr:alpha/beta hydrolase [Actinocorallia sp. API 0066]MCD0451555.1 alpha/beta hydrolase [Actinocorallia sp. API 0066]
MKMNVTFPSAGLNLAGHLYLPDDYTGTERRAAVVVSHPFGGVKEQTAGLYAERLAGRGFVTLTFDAAYQGESEGEPRFLENPFQRAEDVRSAVTFLTTRGEVDPDRIGALGICASGGYVPFAAQTDHRMKAVATVSGADMGSLFRDGLGGDQAPEVLAGMLDEAGRDRTAEALGAEPRLAHVVPETDADAEGAPDLYREGHDYYRTPRAENPHAPNWFVARSVDQIAQYDSYALVGLISPRPLLMIAGTEADTAYFSKLAVERAGEPKELFWVDGASHIDLYDKEAYVPLVLDKLTDFFTRNLSA